MKWDDIRIFLAVARTGTSLGASKKLGINQSTVSRRLKSFEEDAGVSLFERGASGFALTEAGQEMLEAAEEIEEKFAILSRRVLGRDVRLTGKIRLSLADFLMAPMAPVLAAFGEAYQEIELEVNISNGLVSLGKREADVLLRLAGTAPEHLVGRRISNVSLAIYGAPAYLNRVDQTDLSQLHWIRWNEAWRDTPIERWIQRHGSTNQGRAWINSGLAQTELIAAGLGVGFQLCRTAKFDARLVRIGDPIPLDLSLWLLTHEDLRRTARISAFNVFCWRRAHEAKTEL